ncbi:MAG: hypothetical protein CM15mP40_03870 [Alphaproteobacteria bacterium]|nr:MAG: hypothetical protein CM15mP40_03870 [Alphaproteobacteria bacterium]
MDAKTHEKISTGRSEDKFGISDKKVLRFLKSSKAINLLKLKVCPCTLVLKLYY